MTSSAPLLIGSCMDDEAADVDADGDLEMFVAKEFGANVLLPWAGR